MHAPCPQCRPRTQSQYGRIVDKLGAGACVVLDGATATELPHLSDAEHARRRAPVGHARARRGGGRRARRAPRATSPPAATSSRRTPGGCRAPCCTASRPVWSSTQPVHWMDLARRGLRLARQAVDEGGRATRLRGRVLDQRRRRLRRGREHDPAARAAVRRRAAGSDPARDADGRAAVAVRHGPGAAGHGASGLAVVPPLPARPVQRLRPALGRAGGRRLRPRGGALRADGHRRADDQLHPARPRRRDGVLPARLHRPAARRLPQPRLLHRRGLALRAGRRQRRVRRDGAALARGGSADHRRLLRRRARPRRGRARAARADRWPATTRPRRRRRLPTRASRREPAPAPAWTDRRGRSLHPLPFPDLVADAGVATPSSAQPHGLALPLRPGASARISAAWTSAAAPASSASSSRSTARRTSARSTSTSAPCATPRPTRIATASATA